MIFNKKEKIHHQFMITDHNNKSLKLHQSSIRSLLDNAFLLATKKFLADTTLHGCRFLVEPHRMLIERLMWLCVEIIVFSVAVYICIFAWDNFTLNPTYTTLQSLKNPIRNVPFPAVGVCSNNRISKSAAMSYAKFLHTMDKNVSELWFFQRIRSFGKLLDYDADGFDELIRFQEILEGIDPDHKTGLYDIGTRMLMLTPKCEELILRCEWMGIARNCSHLFQMHYTMDGHCCTFNYFLSQNVSEKDVYKSPTYGSNNGLIILLNASAIDYYYPIKNFIGFTIQLFASFDFPEEASGSFLQQIITPNSENFISLEAKTIKTDYSVLRYSYNQRGCLFDFEFSEIYDGHYSYSDCIVRCRIRNVFALCRCVPYFWPKKFVTEYNVDSIQCTLSHLECLNRYKKTMNIFKPQQLNADVKIESMTDSIDCSTCYPLCSNVHYSTKLTDTPLVSNKIIRKQIPLLKDFAEDTNLSVVRIYFPTINTYIYKSDVFYTWFEIISYMGGMLGICVGVSIISLTEIIYFYTYRFAQYFLKLKNDKNNNGIESKNEQYYFETQVIPTYKDIEIILAQE